MEVTDLLLEIMENSMRGYGLTDLAVGTVVSVSPLKVKVREDMDALPEETLWLTSAVIEKKIPILKHKHTTAGFRHNHILPDLSHSHALPDISHTHSTSEGETGTALNRSLKAETSMSGSFQTETSLNPDAYISDEQLTNIVCYEDGKPLPVKDGYIILNRGLEEGDKVLLLRVRREQQSIILSRIFERGAQIAAEI